MTTQQPEALRLADDCEESATNWVHEIDTRAKAAKMLRRLHAESELHQQELRSYRITVENREARIVELEARVQELEAAQAQRVALSRDDADQLWGACLKKYKRPGPYELIAEFCSITQEKQG